MTLASLLVLVLAVLSPAGTAVSSNAVVQASPGWGWPVSGPVIRGFDPPASRFGSGHRGIDIAASIGSVVVAPEAGIVAFAGKVGGELFVTLDHGGGIESTYSWLSGTLVRKGDGVARGAPIALSGRGHVGTTIPHLHFGVLVDEEYVDPMSFLGPLSVSSFIRLAPTTSSSA